MWRWRLSGVNIGNDDRALRKESFGDLPPMQSSHLGKRNRATNRPYSSEVASPSSRNTNRRTRCSHVRTITRKRGQRHASTTAAAAAAAATTATLLLLLCFLPSLFVSASSLPEPSRGEVEPSNLWDAISRDPEYSKLTACLEMADPAVEAALKASGEQPLTLFAPKNSAFERPDWAWTREALAWASAPEVAGAVAANDNSSSIFNYRCQDGESATALVSYHVSTTTSSTPYIGEEFQTLLGEGISARFYGIPKTPDVPASYFPVQFVDAANVTAVEAPVAIGGTSYLFPVDRVLRPPVGTIWETLLSDPFFSLLTAALNSTDLARALDGAGGSATRYTLFAPDNDAIRASSDFPQDAAALGVLLSFHTVAAGIYPLSLTGAHFSQQLYRVDSSGGSLSRDYYRDFYEASFQGGQVTSLAGPLLNVSRSDSSPSSSSCSSSSSAPSCPTAPQHEEDTVAAAAAAAAVVAALAGSQRGRILENSEASPSFSSSSSPSLPVRWNEKESSLSIEGVPISEADITATNGVVHRLSAVMAPPLTVAGVMLSPPFPLSAAGVQGGGGGEEGSGFEALGELVRLAWPLVNETLTEEGPLTVLAPTDAAFDLAIAEGHLPPRPWNDAPPPSPLPLPFFMTPERAKRLLLSHTLKTPEGPLLFSPTAADPFASGFTDDDRFSTAVGDDLTGLGVGVGTGMGAEEGSGVGTEGVGAGAGRAGAAGARGGAAVEAGAGRGPAAVEAGVGRARAEERAGLTEGVRMGVGVGMVKGESGEEESRAKVGGGRARREGGGGRGGAVEVGVRVLGVGTRSATTGTADVLDREVYVDGARVFQCADGAGVGHDCGSTPRPSNTYALNGAHLCVVHAVDRVLFPADPDTDLAALLDGTPSLSRFTALLREHGFLAPVKTTPTPAAAGSESDRDSSSSSSGSSSSSSSGSRGVDSDRGSGSSSGSRGVDSDRGSGSGSGRRSSRSSSSSGGDGSFSGGGGGSFSGNFDGKFSGGDFGGSAGEGGGGGGGMKNRDRTRFTTVFAPTNDALNRLERQRPWLFQNSSSPASPSCVPGQACGGGGVSDGEGEGEGVGGMGGPGGAGGYSPVRELLAYHLVPDGALFSRYFNATSQRVQTLALDGRAPIAASFAPSNQTAAGPSRREGGVATRAAAAAATAAAAAIAANGAGTGGSALRVNLQACSSTDRSASDGVLHVLSFVDGNVIGGGGGVGVGDGGGGVGNGGSGDGVGGGGGVGNGGGGGGGDGSSVGGVIPVGSRKSVGNNGGATDGNNDDDADSAAGGDDGSAAGGVGDGGVGIGVGEDEVGGRVGGGQVGGGIGGGGGGGIDGVDGAGVLVPDVLELTYAFGFRKTYEAIISAASAYEAAEKTAGVTSGSTVTVPGDALGGASTASLAAAGARTTAGVGEGTGAGTGAEAEGGEDAPPVSPSRGDAQKMTVADALRGAAAHTLLAVADSETEQAASRTISSGSSEGSGLSAATLRYQTLVGDQTLSFLGSPWVRLETLFGADAHAFDNSENPGNPFVPGNGSALHVDQAQVVSFDGDMIALNGRIHQISEPLREPASDVFSLLSSTPELSGWADWVQLTGLAELLADPSLGPFTVFAPVDAALELIPGRMIIAADAESLLPLLQFHVVVGTGETAAAAPGGEKGTAAAAVSTAGGGGLAAAVASNGGGGGFWDRFGLGRGSDGGGGNDGCGDGGGGGGGDGGVGVGVGGSDGGNGGGGGGGGGGRGLNVGSVDVGGGDGGGGASGGDRRGGGGGGAGGQKEGAKLFTPSLANATLEERSVFSGERFVSGRELWTLLGDDAGTLSVQIAAAPAASGDDSGGSSGSDGGNGASGKDSSSGVDGAGAAGIRVFVGVGRRRAEGEGAGGDGGLVDGLGDLFVGAFAAEVVLPDLNAVNGVVHGVAGVVTYPGYVRPAAAVEVED